LITHACFDIIIVVSYPE